MNKPVQQTLIDYTKPTLAKERILEYKFSHPELSDSEERKDNSDNGAGSENPGSSPVATHGHGGRPRCIFKHLRDENSSEKKRKQDQPPCKHQRNDSRDSRRGSRYES